MQSNIFIVSAAYIFKSFNCIFFQTKRLQKSFYPRVARDYFLFHPAGG